MKKANIVLGIFIIGSVVILGRYIMNGMSTEGYFIIEENTKFKENGKYYLILEDKKIEVSKKVFDRIEENKHYDIKFSWNKLNGDKGKLAEINLDVFE